LLSKYLKDIKDEEAIAINCHMGFSRAEDNSINIREPFHFSPLAWIVHAADEAATSLLDYFVDKIYIDDDGKLSFVLKLYDKDEVELQEVSEDEIFDFVGVEVFDNFGLCSTEILET